MARAALREPDLPTAQLAGPERNVRLLLDHREDLVAERTRSQNRLRWHLHELQPGHEPPARSLDRPAVLAALRQQLAARPGMVAPSLLELVGCGVLTAAKLVGETADVRRFRTRAAFARHNGTAPVPVWSGNTERVWLNRGGNRQLNAALHRIAVTQLRQHAAGRAYVERRMAAGHTKTEAIRALRRRLSDEVYRCMLRGALGESRLDATHA